MQYDLVFEGGGAKGMVFVGALQEFQARGHTWGRLLGTSAGAITAALLAAGYTADEMLVALNEKGKDGRAVFAGFLEPPPEFSPAEIRASRLRTLLRQVDVPLLIPSLEDRLDDWLAEALLKWSSWRNLFAFIERGGWFSAQNFITWLESRLDSGAYQGRPRRFSGLTLAEFFAATGVELTVVAADTSEGCLLVLNHSTAPDCPLVWAVRMSMNIPLLWPEVVWQAGWGPYRGKDLTGHLVVDGGLLSNFPIELFVSNEPPVTAVMGPKQSLNVLGLLIDETMPVEGAPVAPARQTTGLTFEQLPPVQQVARLVNTATQAHDKMVIAAFEQLVVRLPAHGYGTTEFDMSDGRREALVEAGRRKMAGHLEQVRPASLEQVVPPAIDVLDYANEVALDILNR